MKDTKKSIRNSPKMEPTFDNDQLGENASETHANDYAQKGKKTKSKNK